MVLLFFEVLFVDGNIKNSDTSVNAFRADARL